jgi:hypothetical protein
VGQIYLAFTNYLLSKTKSTSSWRTDLTSAAWRNFFEILPVLEDYIFKKPVPPPNQPYGHNLKLGFHFNFKVLHCPSSLDSIRL